MTVIHLETSLGGIIPTAFDRILAKRLGEKAMETIQKNIDARDCAFQTVGIKGKRIVPSCYEDSAGKHNGGCSKVLEKDLQLCFDLMAQQNETCIGVGGTVQWGETTSEDSWHGKWTCHKCGHTQKFLFNPNKMLCVYCEKDTCHNYGYVRISRRL